MKGIEFLIHHNGYRADEFMRDQGRRRRWRRTRQVEIAAFVCSDGRVRLPSICNLPLGIVQSYPNIGAKFDVLRWIRLRASVVRHVSYARRHKRWFMTFLADHYAAGDNSRGCRGHECDTERARASSRELKAQLDRLFAGEKLACAIHISVETDNDVITFYGRGEKKLDLSLLVHKNRREVRGELRELFPELSGRPFFALLEIAMGNIEHQKQLQRSGRPSDDIDHAEWVLAVGQGKFDDWLRERNMALIVSPYDPTFESQVRTAAGILASNIHRRGFDERRGLVLLAAAQFNPDDGSVGRRAAELEAMELKARTIRAIERSTPNLIDQMGHLTAIVNVHDRRINVL